MSAFPGSSGTRPPNTGNTIANTYRAVRRDGMARSAGYMAAMSAVARSTCIAAADRLDRADRRPHATGGIGRVVPATRPPALLAFDHAAIPDTAVERLRGRLDYTAIGFELLLRKFTLSELQRLHEAILGEALDKRNFRTRVDALGLVRPLDESARAGAGRPAQLFSFRRRSIRSRGQRS